jgi:hypothetical protein
MVEGVFSRIDRRFEGALVLRPDSTSTMVGRGGD